MATKPLSRPQFDLPPDSKGGEAFVLPSRGTSAKQVAAVPAAVPLILDRWVIQTYPRGEFLQYFSGYDGLQYTKDLSKARLFKSAGSAASATFFFGLGRVRRVLVDADGRNVRIALFHEARSLGLQ